MKLREMEVRITMKMIEKMMILEVATPTQMLMQQTVTTMKVIMLMRLVFINLKEVMRKARRNKTQQLRTRRKRL